MSELQSEIQEYVNNEILLLERCKGTINQLNFKKWFRDSAELFRNIDKKTSDLMCLTHNAQIKACYANSFRAWTPYFKYYEGFVMTCGVPIEHSWLVKDDQVVDLTLAINGKEFVRQFKKYKLPISKNDTMDRFATEYYGVNIPFDFVRKNTIKRRTFGNNIISYYFEEITK